MSGQVGLSEQSQSLLKEYLALCQERPEVFADNDTTLDRLALVAWLHEEAKAKAANKKLEFITTSLRMVLLKDLCRSLPGELDEADLEPKQATTAQKTQFILLGVAGTIVAACQGFDSISTLMVVFSSPTMAVLIAGLAFALLSVVLFYAVDLAQVAKDAGVSLTDAPKLLDIYAMQRQEIQVLIKKLRSYSLTTLSTKELAEMAAIADMMQAQLELLKESALTFDTARQGPYVKAAQIVFTVISGLLYFGGGFFAGQTVGFFVLGLITTAPMIWPVILFSALVGVAAFGLYWYLQRESLNRVISSLFGLDEDKIDTLIDIPKQEEKELAIVRQQIQDTLAWHSPNQEESESLEEVLPLSKKSRNSSYKASAAMTLFGEPEAVETPVSSPSLCYN